MVLQKNCQRVYFDSCAFNFFHENSIDPLKQLPVYEFQIWITENVRVELESIPETKKELRVFVETMLEHVKIDGGAFRFDSGPGFDQARFASIPKASYHNDNSSRYRGKRKRPTGLRQKEADTENGAISQEHVLLTTDHRDLKKAQRSGGKVVFLDEWDRAMSLKEIISSLAEREKFLD